MARHAGRRSTAHRYVDEVRPPGHGRQPSDRVFVRLDPAPFVARLVRPDSYPEAAAARSGPSPCRPAPARNAPASPTSSADIAETWPWPGRSDLATGSGVVGMRREFLTGLLRSARFWWCRLGCCRLRRLLRRPPAFVATLRPAGVQIAASLFRRISQVQHRVFDLQRFGPSDQRIGRLVTTVFHRLPGFGQQLFHFADARPP